MRKGWEYKKLGEVCALTMGQSPDGNSINEVNGIEFHQGKTCFGERFLGISPLYSNAPTKLAEAHSVLLCVRAPVGYPNITDRKICIGRGLCALYAKREIDNSFLYYSLLGKQSYFEKNATGSTFKAISSKIVSNTTLSIPPLSTQLAIVSELDKINELIRLKKEQLKDFDNLAQSLFYEMFGDPVENEKGWEAKKLGEIGEFKNGLINALGVKFGLWFEPEMVNEDSDLYREHPDWAIQIPGRKPVKGRNQLLLDFSRKEVVDAVYEQMCQVLDQGNIEYVKWDMNRSMAEVYSMTAEEQGSVQYDYDAWTL